METKPQLHLSSGSGANQFYSYIETELFRPISVFFVFMYESLALSESTNRM